MMEHYQQKILAYSIPEPNSGCWLWEKSIGNHGYGNFCIDGQVMTAPRASVKAYICTDIPKNVQVLHKCDNRLCVNPGHLMLGSHKDNMAQASMRRRFRNQHGNLTLSSVDVQNILNDDSSQRKIANKYGVSQGTIARIKRGKLWV